MLKGGWDRLLCILVGNVKPARRLGFHSGRFKRGDRGRWRRCEKLDKGCDQVFDGGPEGTKSQTSNFPPTPKAMAGKQTSKETAKKTKSSRSKIMGTGTMPHPPY